MMSLFSPFDLFFFNKFFLVLILTFSFLLIKFWKTDVFNMFFQSMSFLGEFFLSLKPKSFNKGTLVFLISLILLVSFLNLSSVFSFTFPAASSFGMVFFMALMFWISLVFFSVFKSTQNFLSHLIPEGSPLGLSMFLFLIELISSIIRPLTLTVRLTANILAGHLLMILLSKLVFMLPPIVVLYALLNLVEFFVSIIQAYIFCTMISLYFAEVH